MVKIAWQSGQIGFLQSGVVRLQPEWLGLGLGVVKVAAAPSHPNQPQAATPHIPPPRGPGPHLSCPTASSCGCCTTDKSGRTYTMPLSRGMKPTSRFTSPSTARTCPSAPSNGRPPTSNKKIGHAGAHHRRSAHIHLHPCPTGPCPGVPPTRQGRPALSGRAPPAGHAQPCRSRPAQQLQLTEWLRNQSRRTKSQPTAASLRRSGTRGPPGCGHQDEGLGERARRGDTERPFEGSAPQHHAHTPPALHPFSKRWSATRARRTTCASFAWPATSGSTRTLRRASRPPAERSFRVVVPARTTSTFCKSGRPSSANAARSSPATAARLRRTRRGSPRHSAQSALRPHSRSSRASEACGRRTSETGSSNITARTFRTPWPRRRGLTAISPRSGWERKGSGQARGVATSLRSLCTPCGSANSSPWATRGTSTATQAYTQSWRRYYDWGSRSHFAPFLHKRTPPTCVATCWRGRGAALPSNSLRLTSELWRLEGMWLPQRSGSQQLLQCDPAEVDELREAAGILQEGAISQAAFNRHFVDIARTCRSVTCEHVAFASSLTTEARTWAVKFATLGPL